MSTPSQTVLRITNLSITHGDTFALHVDGFEMTPGQCVSVYGESGSGKSSLLDVVALMAPASKIESYQIAAYRGGPLVELEAQITPGRIADCAPMRSSVIGYAPQSGGMLPFLNARADSGTSAQLSTPDPAAWESRQQSYAKRLGIDGHLGKNRGALSGGQRKRVSLLRALALPRVLLVLDEPTSGLDDATALEAMRIIRQTAEEEGTACLIASHDVTLARKTGFNVFDLKDVAHVHMREDRQ